MEWPEKYKCVSKEFVIEINEFKIVPIRYQDRYLIMKWRNEQLYHLRQENSLSKKDQDLYFEKIIKKQFDEFNPNQILVSFLKNNKCIGYGGLVHINWGDKNAEISFIIDTKLEKDYFNFYWGIFLKMIENFGFSFINMKKLYVYSFNLRPKLYEVLLDSKYIKEASLKNHVFYNDKFVDVYIHSKFSN